MVAKTLEAQASTGQTGLTVSAYPIGTDTVATQVSAAAATEATIVWGGTHAPLTISLPVIIRLRCSAVAVSWSRAGWRVLRQVPRRINATNRCQIQSLP